MFRSLRVRNYRIWFAGALFSNIGAWMQATAQNWVVLTELSDNDAVAVGITMALQFGPQLLLVPLSGAFADRFDRRRLLLVTQSLLMLLALGLGIMLVLGIAELWHLYAFALGLGVVNAFDTPARQAFVSDVVGHEQLSNAVALNSASFNSARLVGPAVAGVLIAMIGSGWVFVVNAVTFIAMLTALVAIRIAPRPPTEASARESQWQQLTAGFSYVLRRHDLVVIFIIVFLIGSFGMNFPIISSTMAVEFDRGAGEYGLLSSILAIGSLAGALLVARRPAARLRGVIIAAGGFGIASLAAALMPTFWTFAAMLIGIGFSTSTLLSTANGFVQTTVDPRLRGRVLSLYFAILLGGTPVGAPVVGAVTDAFGPRWGLGVGAAAGIIACAVGIGWLIVERRLRVHVHLRGEPHVAFTHAGRPGVDDDPASQSETLTAPIEVLRRGPVIIADPNSAPQPGPLTEAFTGPIPTRPPDAPDPDPFPDPDAPSR